MIHVFKFIPKAIAQIFIWASMICYLFAMIFIWKILNECTPEEAEKKIWKN